MKLIQFKYYNPQATHPLNNFDEKFRSTTWRGDGISPICLVGINGSGKSKLLENLAEVMQYVIGYYTDYTGAKTTTKIQFNIKYLFKVHGGYRIVSFVQDNEKGGAPQCFIGHTDKDMKIVEDEKTIKNHLPRRVVGYTSGENESLSRHFYPLTEAYAEYYQSRAIYGSGKEDKFEELNRFLWVDFTMNHLIFIVNAIYQEHKDSKWVQVIKRANGTGIRSFRITLRLKPRLGPKAGIIPAQEQLDIISKLRKCTPHIKEHKSEDTEVLDFYYSTATVNAFITNFGESPLDLYNALLALEQLNHVVVRGDIKELKRIEKETGERMERPKLQEIHKSFSISHIRMHHKIKGTVIHYNDLSDGEHQLLHVSGTINLFKEHNVLYLMDEPETHFNPQWRSEFISSLERVAGKYQEEFVITTHSPFLLSDSKKENVFIFNNEKGEIKITQPKNETYGASVERLLKIAFGISPPVALKSSKELIKLINNEDISIEDLESRVSDFGESFHKLGLYQKIRELNKAKD